MRKLIVCLALLITLPLMSGATLAKRQLHSPDPLFFLQNNDDVMEALQSYAEMLCRQDASTGVRLSAHAEVSATARPCGDSKRNADGDSLSNDGKWHDYVWLAYNEITAMCAGVSEYGLCRWFKG